MKYLPYEYAERYDWLKQQFVDWAFNALTVFLYYNDKDALNDDSKALMRQGTIPNIV